MADKRSAPSIRAMKGTERIACLTAYDATSGLLADRCGADLVLVGDSAGNTMLGHATTLFVDLDDMVRFTSAVARSVKRALVVADLPFGSYQSSPAQAVDSSVALMKAGAQAVKLEGPFIEAIEAIVRAGIPVMGHVGFTPQSVHAFGGFRAQGKNGGQEVIEAARRIDQAGVFSMVIELVPAQLAGEITRSVECPTIGIGAGPECDGQVQVFHDVLGLAPTRFRHAKRYAEGTEIFAGALERYICEVKCGEFPTEEHSV